MLKKHAKYFTADYLAANQYQVPESLQDKTVLKILDAMTQLKSELANSNFNVADVYVNRVEADGDNPGYFYAVLFTDAECATWMIREFMPENLEVLTAEWREGRYFWEEKHYWPPELSLTIKLVD